MHSRLICIDVGGDEVHDTKVLGIYTTKAKATEAINRFSKLSGFCDYPNDYHIKKMRLYISDDKPLLNAHLIEFEYLVYGNTYYMHRIGCYDTETAALEKIATLQQRSIYKKHSEGFEIIPYKLNHDSEYWGEGFD